MKVSAMAKKQKTRKQKAIDVLEVIVIGIIVYTLTLTFYSMPDTLDDAREHTDSITPLKGNIYWSYKDCHNHTRYDHIDLGITQEEFENSMNQSITRVQTVFDPIGLGKVSPNDKYVQLIAERILKLTERYTIEQRIIVALNFVQTAIDYSYDEDTYGCDGFIAYPLETLYLGIGDCEDTSILLMSILLAMSIDCVLLDYPTHLAVGVRWEGQEKYMLCETTSSIKTSLRKNLEYEGDSPTIYRYDSVPEVCYVINDTMGWYRCKITDIFGV